MFSKGSRSKRLGSKPKRTLLTLGRIIPKSNITLQDIWDLNYPLFNERGERRCKLKRAVRDGKSLNVLRFRVSCSESWSAPYHDCWIAFQNLNRANLAQSKIKIFCDCEAFQYWGVHYNATMDEYNLSDGEYRPPDIRDPNRERFACKHIITVAHFLKGKSYKKLGLNPANFDEVI